MNSKLSGYFFGALAGISYGMNPLFAVKLYKNGLNVDSVLLFRYLLAIPLIAVILKMRGHSFKLTRQQLLLLFLMGLLMAFCSLLLYESYNYLSAGIASTILFIYPVVVALFMTLFYKEKITLRTIACLILVSLGILFLYKTEEGVTLSLLGVLLSIGSAVTYALYLVAVNKKQLRQLPSLKLTFYVLLCGAVLFMVRVMTVSEFICPPASDLGSWANIICMAVIPTVLSFACTAKSIKLVGSTATSILGALEPLTAVVLGILFLGESLTVKEGLGLALILCAVCMVITASSPKANN